MKQEDIEARISKLENRVSRIEIRGTLPQLFQRMIDATEDEIKKETDAQRLEALHYRLQQYISLAIQHNKF